MHRTSAGSDFSHFTDFQNSGRRSREQERPGLGIRTIGVIAYLKGRNDSWDFTQKLGTWSKPVPG